MLSKTISNLADEVIRLNNKNSDLKAIVSCYKDELEKSNTNARLYRENLIEANKKNKELLDFIANMLANVGKPISEEIKKYEENM